VFVLGVVCFFFVLGGGCCLWGGGGGGGVGKEKVSQSGESIEGRRSGYKKWARSESQLAFAITRAARKEKRNIFRVMKWAKRKGRGLGAPVEKTRALKGVGRHKGERGLEQK